MKYILKEIEHKNRYKSPYGEKYFYKTNLTTGLIIGSILDLIMPCTFGIIGRFFSRFGKTILSKELKSNRLTNILIIGGLIK